MLDTGATLICRCEEILLEEIVAALAAGAQTVNDVKRRTRAGMGACQGIFCVPVIAAMVAQATGVPSRSRGADDVEAAGAAAGTGGAGHLELARHGFQRR